MKRALILIAAIAFSGASTHLSERERAQHALNRLAFGAKPGDVERLTAIGVDKWIDQQLHPERVDDRALDAKLQSTLPTLSMSSTDIVKKFYLPVVERRREAKGDEEKMKEMRSEVPFEQRPQRVMEELTSQRILRATDSKRQLNEVMVDFWMNHFNVFAGKGVDRFLLTSYERDTIRPRIWGHFEDLLMATAKSPAMLFYLDNARSHRGGLNENYAREIMELHTLGVDGGYTQKDVTELARVLTGWSIKRPQEGGSEFVFRRGAHDRDSKLVLGQRIPENGGIEEGERMIHFLAHHPSTAHFISYKLCQRLVADDPPKALVDRVAKRFLDTNGDLREVVRAVIDSREFWDPANVGAKMKSPFEYVISALRSVDAKVYNPLPIARTLQQIGEPLYFAQPPTGYSDKAEAWMNSGALMNRLNFAVALSRNEVPGVMSARIDDPDKLAKTIGSPEFQKQ